MLKKKENHSTIMRLEKNLKKKKQLSLERRISETIIAEY